MDECRSVHREKLLAKLRNVEFIAAASLDPLSYQIPLSNTCIHVYLEILLNLKVDSND